MAAEAQDTHTLATSTDSATISTRSGHPPGTPKPPISPPRRRSSLAFSQLFTCSSPRKDDSDEPESPRKTTAPLRRNPSNTSRKRVPASVHRSTVTPGHVAQMQQKLLQSAKAALRVDMAFAASPTGSIGSRLPADKVVSPEDEITDVPTAISDTPQRDWRFSIAPQLVAAPDSDVREPVLEGSPTLPNNFHIADESGLLTIEPISSGFTSPANIHATPDQDHLGVFPSLPSSPPLAQELQADELRGSRIISLNDASDIEGPMTELKVCSDEDSADAGTEESPTISHLKRMSADPMKVAETLPDHEDEIFLPESVKAAAESAKIKRGLLRSLFPRKENSKSTTPTETADSPKPLESSGTPCPDPGLHRLFAEGKCPDPTAHLMHQFSPLMPPAMSVPPDATLSLPRYPPNQYSGAWHPPQHPIHRATATGSPMPFARTKSQQDSPEPEMYHSRQTHYSDFSAPRMPLPTAHSPRPGTRSGRPHVAMTNEHFQPGWYYARETHRQTEVPHPMYSFSTEAAKVGGQSVAPDFRIRDSYRTDTLTPLSRPPNRFRKTGVGALASSRGVSRICGDQEHDHRPPSSKMAESGRPRRVHDDVQFRSSPPRQVQRWQPRHKRRRPREFEDENIAIREDARPNQPRLEKEDSVMDVDDETRAAVRMSIFGPETPEARRGPQEGLVEISPNVTSWRKGMRQPKKKRRPSYWDSDLKQVRGSPASRFASRESNVSTREAETSPPDEIVKHDGAERRVLTSPGEEASEHVEEQIGVIGFDGDSQKAGLVGSGGETEGSFMTGDEMKSAEVERMGVDAEG